MARTWNKGLKHVSLTHLHALEIPWEMRTAKQHFIWTRNPRPRQHSYSSQVVSSLLCWTHAYLIHGALSMGLQEELGSQPYDVGSYPKHGLQVVFVFVLFKSVAIPWAIACFFQKGGFQDCSQSTYLKHYTNNIWPQHLCDVNQAL